MIQDLLSSEEGKTLEFKENASSLLGIVKTVAAFANTAGGTIVIGIQDKTKAVVGLTDPLEDEMRIIGKIAETIKPFFRPTIEIQTYRDKSLILVQVPYGTGPYYLEKGSEKVVYVRFGSTNRMADESTVATIKSLAKNTTFDENPCPHASKKDIDWEGMTYIFASVDKQITEHKAKSMGILADNHPSNGGVLLFGKHRTDIFPDAVIRCVRFNGLVRENTLDHLEIDTYLPKAVEEVLYFIRKNTTVVTTIGRMRREEIPQYPPVAVREAVINAIVHADYSITGSCVMVALFDDRIEITNPGSIPYGLSLQDALAGSSRVRNRVIARTFHTLNLIEQWGSGLQKIIQSCIRNGLKEPRIEEMYTQFRVTIYSEKVKEPIMEDWQQAFVHYLRKIGEISTQDAAKFWAIDSRTARARLKQLVDDGLIARIGTSRNDPRGIYVVR